jgi:GH24 family phage-related lysozyme (muramidase)
MAETISGGAYQNPDGSWHDANGKPLPSSKVQEVQAKQAERAEEVRRAEFGVSAETAPLAPAPVILPSPEDEVEEPAGKRSRSKKA